MKQGRSEFLKNTANIWRALLQSFDQIQEETQHIPLNFHVMFSTLINHLVEPDHKGML